MSKTKYRYPGAQPFTSPRLRYPGLNYFTAEQNVQFFGRDDEKEVLLGLAQTEKIVVLFGKSGYGKSSLLRAGLIPLLNDEMIPIIVQLGAYQSGQSLSPMARTLAQLDAALPNDCEETAFLDTLQTTQTSLWHRFKRKQGSLNRPFLLLFDQFEEFDSYPPAERETFKQQLAELLFTHIPQAVRDISDELPEAQQALLARSNEVKTIFAIREDRLSVLDSLADKLPAILHKRYRLGGLTDKQAREAVVKPAALPQHLAKEDTGQSFMSPSFSYSPVALDALLRGLKKNDSEALVESFLLQICCEEIEGSVIRRAYSGGEKGDIVITEGDLPIFKDLFEQYYRNKIASLPDEATQQAAHRMIEDELVKTDPASGIAYRINVDGRILSRLQGVDEDLLKHLTDVFLLRSEPNTTDGVSYEISHDRLVDGILVAKKEYETSEVERRREQERLETERQAKEAKALAILERRKRRKADLITAVAVLMLLVAAVLGVWAFQQKAEAEKQTEIAVEKTEDAIKQTAIAQAAKLRSDSLLDQVYKEQGRTKTAQEDAQQKESARKKEESEKNKLRFDELIKQAETLFKAKLYPNAKQKYQDALKLAPTPEKVRDVQDKINLCN